MAIESWPLGTRLRIHPPCVRESRNRHRAPIQPTRSSSSTHLHTVDLLDLVDLPPQLLELLIALAEELQEEVVRGLQRGQLRAGGGQGALQG